MLEALKRLMAEMRKIWGPARHFAARIKERLELPGQGNSTNICWWCLIDGVQEAMTAATYPTTMPAKTSSLLRMKSGEYSGPGPAAESGEDDAAGTWQ